MNNIEKKTTNLFKRFGQDSIYKKALLVSLGISIIPILVFGLYTIITLNSTKDEIVNEIQIVVEDKVRDALELQAFQTANLVSRFLKQRETDLINLSDIIPTDKHYLDFARVHKSEIWIRTGYNETPHEAHLLIPIYKEIAFIDSDGYEKVKIENNSIVPKRYLKNVSKPENTTYGVEEYFNETAKLKRNEIYVSHITGYYITGKEQLGDAKNIEEAVESPIYNGVIRMGMPIYNDSNFIGVVMLAIDHQHLMEFTQHILPNSKERTVFPVYESGNYAFMFDDNGWIITHPKYWDIPGLDKDGNWVKAYNKNSSREDIKEGRIPFNLDTAGFVHPNYPKVAHAVRNKETGSVVTTNIGGVRKVMAYAPIIYETGDYEKYGVFGGITIGAEFEEFTESTIKVAEDLSGIILLVRDNVVIFVILTFMITAVASWLFSKSLTNPVVKMTSYAKQLASGEKVAPLVLNRTDEIGVLSNTFNHMASELHKSNLDLMESLESLKESKDEIENYTRDLEYQIRIFKTIQDISNILGSSTRMEMVLKYILKSCIESLKFDRAVLYLLDESGQYLEYQENFGLSPDEEARAKKARYNVTRQDCIETRVLKSGEIIFVEDFKNYSNATDFDRIIYRSSKSDSFVYVPLKVKEKIIGILGADKQKTKNEIQLVDINSLQIFANQASRIIENSRLYQEISEQRNFFEDIIRYMVKGVVTIDNDGIITSINQAARQIFDLDDTKVIGSDSLQLLNDYPEIRDLLKKILISTDNEIDLTEEIKIEFNEKIITVSFSELEPKAGKKSGFIIIIEDVSQKKRMDDHLHHLDRLASMGKFAAGIAHEIRNPLTGISVFLDDLHDKVESKIETKSFITMALKEIERLETLVNELLEYSTPTGASKSSRNINDVIESTLHFTEKQARDSGVKIELKLDNDIPPIEIDSEKIRQALLNIVLNAVQILDKGGIIRITSTFIPKLKKLSFKANENTKDASWIKINIEDSGPGIPAEHRSRIFDPFYSQRPSGTGLGLSITQSIISEHDGIIEVLQSDLHGAMFSIYLPYKNPEEENS